MEPFGIGHFYMQPGKSGSYVETMILQDISLDFKFDQKELYGPFQFPVSVKRGKGSIDGMAKFARMRSDVLAAVFNETVVAGQTFVQDYVTAIPATPFTITPAAPNSGTLKELIGVWFAIAGDTHKFELITSGTPTTGQVKWTGGVLTFAAADTLLAIRIVYLYTNTITNVPGAHSFPITNKAIGATPVMKASFVLLDVDKPMVFEMNSVIPGGLKFASKIDDWTQTDLPFKCFPDCAGNIGTISLIDLESC